MFFKYLICLLIGLIIGIRLTDIWDYVSIQKHCNVDEQQAKRLSAASNIPMDYSLETHVDFSHSLYNSTRVLCWIMTAPQNHAKAWHVKNTWGKRCNRLIFMSTQEDRQLGAVQLQVQEGRQFLWNKTREAFKYVHEHHFEEADWFLKADDDTYFIMENLRVFLYQFAAEAPVYFGCKFHPFVKQGYMSGGAGYVLSKEALRRFATIAYPNTTLCSRNLLSEDKEMGLCMQNIGVVAGDSRDELGRDRFLPLSPHHLIPFDRSEWFGTYAFYKRYKKVFHCSTSAISFHYIKPRDFYVLDYLLYGLRAFGVHSGPAMLPPKANMTKLVDKWRHELSDNILKT